MSAGEPQTIIQCPACQGQSRVAGAGRYLCPHCRKVLAVSPDGAVRIDPSPPQGETAPRPAPGGSYDACAFHPDRRASAVCQQCGKLICAECTATEGGRLLCPACRDVHAGSSANAWENRRQTGLARAVAYTVRDTLLRPREFFSQMGRGTSVGGAFLYGVLVQAFGTLFSFLYALSRGNPIERLRELGLTEAFPMLDQFPGDFFPRLGWAAVASAPFTALISAAMSILFTALVIHLFLFLVGGARTGLESTIKVVSFASAADLFLLLPVMGPMISFVWKAVILIVGSSAAHRISGTRAALAVLLPFIIMVLFVLILAVAIAGLFFSALAL